MSFQELIQGFSQQWEEAAIQRAINRGVPEHLARNRQWPQFINLCPTSAGTWAFMSFGDHRILAEWTMDEIEQALSWTASEEPDTGRSICAHPAHRWSSYDFSDPVGSVCFVVSQYGKDYTGQKSITLEWFKRSEIGNRKVEERRIFLHMDGAVFLVMPAPHTQALLAEVGIVAVDDRRPTNAKEAFEAYKHDFIAAHAPSAERQAELTNELVQFIG